MPDRFRFLMNNRISYFFLTEDIFFHPDFFIRFLYFAYLEAGTLKTAFLWMPLKAFFSIFVSFLLLIVMVFSDLQPLNALLPIFFN